MAENRPSGRRRNVTGTGKGVNRRGSGLGGGPVGSSGGYSGRKTGSSSGGRGGSPLGGSGSGSSFDGSGNGPIRSSGRRGSCGILPIILILLIIFGGGGRLLSGLFGGGGSTGGSTSFETYTDSSQSSGTSFGTQSGSQSSTQSDLGLSTGTQSSAASDEMMALFQQLMGGSYSNGWDEGGSTVTVGSGSGSGSSGSDSYATLGNTGTVDNTVAEGARAKRTQILGNGQDKVTVMVYLCGTDLESNNGMATNDLSEMAKAQIGENVNVLVYTGGCKRWRNSTISNQVNQVYQVVTGGLRRVVENAGTGAMTNPETLSSFIKWTAENYPANRYELILWDHGAGSVGGYAYDEKQGRSGESMSLSGINSALKSAGVTFDIIGFDTCLMSTMETALMLDSYADYLVASEETEPGVGWYYTNWLTALSNNTSISSVDLGKKIVDDFVDECARTCRGQKTTLAVIDLAELAYTAPAPFKAFSESISSMIEQKEYATISTARRNTREFASTSRIDQVDLVDLARKMGTPEGQALSEAILGAVKYNRTSSNMTNAYGLSIFFPYQRLAYVDKAVSNYKAIGIDDSYSRAIRQFATVESSGQAVAGGTGSPIPSLFGDLGSSNPYGDLGSYSGSAGSAELIGTLLNAFLGGDLSSMTGLDSADFLSDRAMTDQEMVEYLADNSFDASKLTWTPTSDGYRLHLEEDQWKLVNGLLLNVFVDDGEGYVDLGMDNVFDFDENGDLIPDDSNAWLAINGQEVAYYFLDETVNAGVDTITGRVPVMLNDQRANLILVNVNGEWSVAGAIYDYVNGETQTIAKSLTELTEGDAIDFVCDYYSYDGEYVNSYYLGETLVVEGDLEVSEVYVESPMSVMYVFTDIYNRQYWTPELPK